MKTANYLIGLAATALLGSLSVAQAAHLPSPCGAGEVGAGTNCMYLVANGVTNTYNSVSGDRDAATGLTLGIDVWIDFNQTAVQGGGFDIVFDTTNVSSMLWEWNTAEFTAGEQTLDGAQSATGWDGIQFDDFAGNGFGGTTGTQNGFALVGTLQLTLTGNSSLLFSLAQPYTDASFPNCFAPGAASGAMGCVPTNFYDLNVTAAVPLPAAVWMMLAGLTSLAGFSRRKS